MPHNIFISYSRHNLAAVKPIKEELESQGFSCWMGLDGVGNALELFSAQNRQAIVGAKAILFIISATSQTSNCALQELSFARTKEKPVLIVRINDDPVDVKFAQDFNDADIIDWRTPEQRNRLFRILELLNQINSCLVNLEGLGRDYQQVNARLEALRGGRTRACYVGGFLGCFVAGAIASAASCFTNPNRKIDELEKRAADLKRRADKLVGETNYIGAELAEISKVNFKIGGMCMHCSERLTPVMACAYEQEARDYEKPFVAEEAASIYNGSSAPVSVGSCGMAGVLKDDSDLGIGIVAPATVSRDDSVMVQAIVDLIDDLPAAIEKAKSLDTANQAVERGTLAVQSVKNGAEMAFQLDIRGLEIEDEDRVQTHKWDGKPFSLQFFASVPNEARKGTHPAKMLVFVDGRPVGRIGFVINVTDIRSGATATAPTEPRGYKEYFVSYSDKDLDRVLPRVQGLRIAKHDFHFFFDKYTLQAGQRYEKEIFDYIDNKADVFLLFWSANSAASEWVEKEWRHALSRQQSSGGIPDIVPVPLARDCPPPPKELSHLHFGDILLNCSRTTSGT